MKLTLLVISLLTLAGCAPVDAVVRRNTSGQPPEYVAGYQDGCGSGFVAAGHPYAAAKKDVNAFISNPLYSTGWNDGFATCKGQYDSIGMSMRR